MIFLPQVLIGGVSLLPPPKQPLKKFQIFRFLVATWWHGGVGVAGTSPFEIAFVPRQSVKRQATMNTNTTTIFRDLSRRLSWFFDLIVGTDSDLACFLESKSKNEESWPKLWKRVKAVLCKLVVHVTAPNWKEEMERKHLARVYAPNSRDWQEISAIRWLCNCVGELTISNLYPADRIWNVTH